MVLFLWHILFVSSFCEEKNSDLTNFVLGELFVVFILSSLLLYAKLKKCREKKNVYVCVCVCVCVRACVRACVDVCVVQICYNLVLLKLSAWHEL